MTTWTSGDDETWFEVQISVPWVVAGTTGVQNAINIAVSEVGKRVNQTSARYSEIVVQDVACPSCGYEYEAALSTVDFALVVLTVMAQFPASSAEESSRVAKRELGVRMKDIPLTVLRARRATPKQDEPPAPEPEEPERGTEADSDTISESGSQHPVPADVPKNKSKETTETWESEGTHAVRMWHSEE
jgi:uncharacterized protein (UPF0212 family)